MNYIVFDLEWNQPFNCHNRSTSSLPFEIIEIGAVKVSEDFEIVSKFNELVRPVVYHKINWRTQKMLQLKKGELEKGNYFTKVCRQFLEWCGENPVFCTWGSQDLTELQRNMAYFKMKPLSESPIAYLDIQRLFRLMTDNEQSISLESAVDSMNVDKVIPFHRAFSDAFYTARIMEKMGKENLQGYSFDLYHIPANRKSEIHYFSGKDYQYISCAYSERAEILENRRIMQINCALCDRKAIRAKIRWFPTPSKNYYCIGICKEHGAIKGRLKIRKYEEGKFFADKLLTYVEMDEIDLLREKKQALKKKKLKEQKEDA